MISIEGRCWSFFNRFNDIALIEFNDLSSSFIPKHLRLTDFSWERVSAYHILNLSKPSFENQFSSLVHLVWNRISQFSFLYPLSLLIHSGFLYRRVLIVNQITIQILKTARQSHLSVLWFGERGGGMRSGSIPWFFLRWKRPRKFLRNLWGFF
jgi:hypothetical protein